MMLKWYMAMTCTMTKQIRRLRLLKMTLCNRFYICLAITVLSFLLSKNSFGRYDPIGFEFDLKQLELALVEAETTQDIVQITEAFSSLANYLMRKDEHVSAIHYLNLAISRLGENKEHQVIKTRLYYSFGVALAYSGSLLESQLAYNRALSLTKGNNFRFRSDIYFNKAFVYTMLNDFALANHFYGLSLSLRQQIEGVNDLQKNCQFVEEKRPILSAKVLVQMAKILRQNHDDLDDSYSLMQCANSILAPTDDYYSLTVKSELGLLLEKQKLEKQAIAFFEAVIAHPNVRSPQFADSSLALMRILSNEASLSQLNQTFQFFKETALTPGKEAPAAVNTSRNRITFILIDLLANLKLPENFFLSDISQLEKIQHPNKIIDLFAYLIDLTAKLGDPESAKFLLSQATALSNIYIKQNANVFAWRASKRKLLDAYVSAYLNVRQNKPNDISVVIDENVIKHAELATGLAQFVAKHYDHSPSVDLNFSKSDLSLELSSSEENTLRHRYDNWIDLVSRSALNTKQAFDETQKLTVAKDEFLSLFMHKYGSEIDLEYIDLQEFDFISTDHDTLILRYIVTEAHSFLLLIGNNYRQLVPLPAKSSLRKLVHDYNQQISAGTSIQDSASNLADSILPISLIRSSGKKKLIVIADDMVHQVPFAALRVPVKGDTQGQTQYLLSEFSLAFSSSFKDYYAAQVDKYYQVNVEANKFTIAESNDKNEHLSSSLNISVFADPYFNKNYLAFAELNASKREAVAIEQTFPNAVIETATEKSATSAFLTSKWSQQANILHIATHGYIDPDNPEIVGLITAPQNDAQGFELLSLSELLSLQRENDLVVISGCETSLGANYAGAGVRSLSRGFISMGAKSVMATIWPVQDKATAFLMQLFYRRLEEFNGDAREALRQAQLDLANTGRFRHPTYWAGFQLHLGTSRHANTSKTRHYSKVVL